MSSSRWSGDVKSLPEDVIFDILLWLPVLSLLRFRSACKSWCALIDSSFFITQHLHQHHHYNCQTSVNDRKFILALPSEEDDPFPNTFIITSVHNFEVPTVKLNLENVLFGYLNKASMATFDGIICMNYIEMNNNDGDRIPTKYIVSLFNPATKQSRVLPRSSVLTVAPPEGGGEFIIGCNMSLSIGFGFDVKTNDYKVVRLFTFKREGYYENRVEVYSLKSDSWRVIDVAVPGGNVESSNTFRPFQKGTCYCWWGYDFNLQNQSRWILCFDFSSEVFRAICIPDAVDGENNVMKQLAVINDNIACISCDDLSHLEIWMLNNYGSSVKEYWAMHIKVVDFCQSKDLLFTPSLLWFSMDGKYVFFEESDDEQLGCYYVCRYDLVTKAIKKHRVQQFFEIVKDPKFGYRHSLGLAVEFKESLISIKGGNW